MASRAEEGRRYREKHGEAINRRRRELRRQKIAQNGPDKERARGRRAAHGSDYDEVYAAMWATQGGRCYLCGDELAVRAELDHDHDCCPNHRSCNACRRGLACTRCNRLIGHVKDDPELLHRIADNLEARIRVTRARIAAKPVQLEMALEHPDTERRS